MPNHRSGTGPETPSSTSAKVLYFPIGLTSSLVAAVAAGAVFKQVWKRVSADPGSDAPKALESEYPMREVVVAAAVQGAIFAIVKAAVHRGGARLFQRATGEWPGD